MQEILPEKYFGVYGYVLGLLNTDGFFVALKLQGHFCFEIGINNIGRSNTDFSLKH